METPLTPEALIQTLRDPAPIEISDSEDSQISNIEKVWKEGYRAFNEGKSKKSNDYEAGSIEHESWGDGWEDALEHEVQS